MSVNARPTARPRRTDAAVPTLAGGAPVEVCIAGAGLAGMIAGYLLAREKRSVMVLDEGPIGGAEMAYLAALPECSCAALVEREGVEAARVAMQGFTAAIDALEAIVRRERIACDFERLDGYALFPNATRDGVQRELEAAAQAGLRHAELVDSAVRYPGLALAHPGKLAGGLARAITHEGGRMQCGVRVRAMENGPVPAIVTSAGHRIQADVIVTPTASIGSPQPAMAHAVALRVPRGAITRALYWDDAARYCAGLRAQALRTSDVLVVAGHGGPPDAMETWARGRFPCATEVLQRFTAQVLQSAPAFRVANRDLDDGARVYLTGTRWGSPLTRAAIAALVIKDVIEGSRGPWAEADMRSACYTGLARQARAQEFA